MARAPELVEFGKRHGMRMVTVADLIRYRLQKERYVQRIGESSLSTAFGVFQMIAYESDIDPEIHIALVMGDVSGEQPVLVRVHSHCVAGDVFRSSECNCNELISKSMEKIGQEGRGVLLYLHHTGRGFTLEKIPDDLSRIVFHGRQFANPERAGTRTQNAVRVRDRRADPSGPRSEGRAAADQPSAQSGGAGSIWHQNHRAGSRPHFPPGVNTLRNCDLRRPCTRAGAGAPRFSGGINETISGGACLREYCDDRPPGWRAPCCSGFYSQRPRCSFEYHINSRSARGTCPNNLHPTFRGSCSASESRRLSSRSFGISRRPRATSASRRFC